MKTVLFESPDEQGELVMTRRECATWTDDALIAEAIRVAE